MKQVKRPAKQQPYRRLGVRSCESCGGSGFRSTVKTVGGVEYTGSEQCPCVASGAAVKKVAEGQEKLW